MINIKLLLPIFKLHLKWHPSRIDCLLHMINGMLISRSTQQQHIAMAFGHKVDLNTSIIRIKRLYRDQKFDPEAIAALTLELLGYKGKKIHLSLDRTNWDYGGTHINFLVLSIVVPGKCAIPLFWTELHRKGNSDTKARIHLVERFIATFGVDRIASLMADREFIGKEWFAYLCKKGIIFFIRIKENTLVEWGKNQTSSVAHFFHHLSYGETRVLHNKTVHGCKVTIAGTYSTENELVIVVTNCINRSARDILKMFLKRWNIEIGFKNAKTKGFNIEDTHIIDAQRLSKLFGVVAIACALCMRVGNPLL